MPIPKWFYTSFDEVRCDSGKLHLKTRTAIIDGVTVLTFLLGKTPHSIQLSGQHFNNAVDSLVLADYLNSVGYEDNQEGGGAWRYVKRLLGTRSMSSSEFKNAVARNGGLNFHV